MMVLLLEGSRHQKNNDDLTARLFCKSHLAHDCTVFLKKFHIQLDHVELHKNFANLHQDKFCLLFMFSSDLVLGFASVVPSYDRSVVTMRN